MKGIHFNSYMAMTILLIIVTTLSSCKSKKLLQADIERRQTVESTSTESRQTDIIDTIRKMFQFSADSIVISWVPSGQGQGNPMPEDPQPSSLISLKGERQQVAVDAPSSPPWHSKGTASPHGNLLQPTTLPRIKIHNPRISSSTEESVIDKSSSSSKSEESMESEDDEEIEQRDAPSIIEQAEEWLKAILFVAAIAIFFSVLYKRM